MDHLPVASPDLRSLRHETSLAVTACELGELGHPDTFIAVPAPATWGTLGNLGKPGEPWGTLQNIGASDVDPRGISWYLIGTNTRRTWP